MKSLPIVFFLLLVSTQCIGQKQFAPLNAVWHYEGHEIACRGNHKKYAVEEEVEIQGKDCSIISSYKWNEDNWEKRSELVVWEDSNKVYFLEDSQFYLLYDFGAEVGDTIFSYDPIDKELFTLGFNDSSELPELVPYKIDSISTIQIDSDLRNIFHTSIVYLNGTYDICVNKSKVIESIGSTSMGFTGEYCYHVSKGCFGRMVCYFNDDIRYETGFMDCDTFHLFTNNVEIEKLGIMAYPNPNNGIFTIDNLNKHSRVDLQITDIRGKNIQFRQRGNDVEILNKSAGVYFIQFVDTANNILGVEKIVLKE